MKISKKQFFGAALIAGLSLMSVNAAFAAEERQADRPKEEAPKTETRTEAPKTDVRLTPDQYFAKLDKNADGFLVEGEIKAEQVKTWDATSKAEDGTVIDADGKVTLAEYKVAIAAAEAKRNQERLKLNAANKFKELDKNADGKVVPEELTKPEMFAKIDADKDGAITLDELKAFMAAEAAKTKDQPKEGVKEQPKEGVREQPREGVKEQPKTGDRE